MSKSIKVKIKTSYGNERIYPICEDAKTSASLAKQKTFTSTEIRLIKALGYTIEVVQEKKEL